LLTGLLFGYEYLYDDGPWPFIEVITDFLIAGTIYTTLFFGIISGVYFLLFKNTTEEFHKN
jgi:hypothetical protein